MAALLAAPTDLLVVTVLIAMLGGFVLFNVFSDELPRASRARYPAFLGAISAYAGLLLTMAALGE